MKIKSKAVSKNVTSKDYAFSVLSLKQINTLLYTTTQPHPSASEGEAECIGDIPPSLPPPISPGSGLNWEICGWDSEGRCGGGVGVADTF